MWLVVVHFACPTISSVPHYCTVSTFHLSSQFVFKMERFHYVSVENRMRQYCQEGFFRLTMWNPNIKVINITKLVQMIFHTWFGYFEYVSYLLCDITLIVLNYVSIWSLTTSTGPPDHGASSSEKSAAWNFANHFWHVLSVAAPSPYTAQIFFLCFSCIFTFLEIIKHNMLKMLLFFLPHSILNWLPKNSPILINLFF